MFGIGIIGCGKIAQVRHIPEYAAHPEAKLVGFYDINQQRAAELAAKYGGRAYATVEELLAEPEIQAVSICAANFAHAELTIAALNAGKHVLCEKPMATNLADCEAMVQAADANGKFLMIGHNQRLAKAHSLARKLIMEGLIGEITGGIVYWNQSMLWYRERQKEWNDCEYMIKDWVNWKWLSGDHIVEQHVHNIDVFTWFSGLKPVKAVGFGSRQRRITGDQYDNFSIDFTMENGIHLHSMCRQIDGCANNVSEFIQGTKGSWNSATMEIKDLAGNVVWKFDKDAEKTQYKQVDPYTLEHVDWINCIRGNKPVEQASETAVANMGAIMGREAAYTGAETTWDAMTASALDYTPKDLNLGKMDMSGFTVPVPGKPLEKK